MTNVLKPGGARLVIGGVVVVAVVAFFGLGRGTADDGSVSDSTDAVIDELAAAPPERRAGSEEQVRAWLHDYDPDEIRYLLDTADPDFGPITDQYMLSVLEYRRSCRLFDEAVTMAKDGQVPAATDMASRQVTRMASRELPGSDSPEVFDQLAEAIGRGEHAEAERYVERNCGDSFGSFEDE